MSAYAAHGVTLDGRSFGRTASGRLGPPVTRAVVRRAGTYAVMLPPSSASPLTLAREADAVAGAQRGPGVRRRSAGAALVVAVFVLTGIAEVKQILRVIPKHASPAPETNIPTWIQAFTQFLTPTGRVTTLTSHDYGAQLRQGSSV